MKTSRLFLVALVFIGSFASADEVYLKTEVLPFSFDTGPRRTSGIAGALFGHLSDADVNRVLAGAAERSKVWSPGEWVRLPFQLDMSVHETTPFKVSTKGMFGEERVAEYRSFGAEGTVKVRVLSGMPLEGSELVGKMKLVARYNAIKVAELELSPADLLNDETLFPYDKYGKMTLHLPARLRYEFGAKLRNTKLTDEVKDIRLSLEFDMANRPYNAYEEVLIERWDEFATSNFASEFYVSKSRFFRPTFYSALCSNLLSSRNKRSAD